MPMYVKKPIPIEARQIADENADELAAWSKSDVIRRPVDGSISGLMVYTLEGAMTGKVGDYLIKGVRGEFYFCAKDIFEETYESVKEIDPWHIQVESISDLPDGSADVVFTIGSEAQKTFLEVGIIEVLKNSIKSLKNKNGENDDYTDSSNEA